MRQPAMWKLCIEDPDCARRIMPLGRDEVRLGRGADCLLRLTERNVSRNHARLRPQADGWLVEDLGSYNGTYINGERISKGELRAGDWLGVGDFELAVYDESQPGAAPPTSRRGERPERLVLLNGPHAGSEFPLGERLLVGADSSVAAHVPYTGVAPRHAELRSLGAGRYELTDHAGSGATSVNGRELAGIAAHAPVGHGDLLDLGGAKFRIVPAGGTSARAAVAAAAPVAPVATPVPVAAPAPSGPVATLAPAGMPQPVTRLPTAEPPGESDYDNESAEETPTPARGRHAGRWVLGGVVAAGLLGALVALSGGGDPEKPKAASAAAEAPALAAAPAEAEPPVIDLDAETSVEVAKAAREGGSSASAGGQATAAADSDAAPPARPAGSDRGAQAMRAERSLVPATRAAASPASTTTAGGAGGIARDNPFTEKPTRGSASIQDLVASGDPVQLKTAKNRLVALANSGKASERELKMLVALCGQLGDGACRKQASDRLAAARRAAQ